MRGLTTGLLVLLLCGLVPSVVLAEDELQVPDRESDYGDLFPFGVRGLPATYREAPGGDARLQAMELGVKWLVSHQAPDGSVPADNLAWCDGKESTTAPSSPGQSRFNEGVTGMAMSAILGTGYTPRGKHRYAEALRRGLKFILSKQSEDGCLGGKQAESYLYNHAFCLLALIDAYAVTGDLTLKVAIQKAMAFTELARNPGLAWRYGIRQGNNDTSVTGCMGLPLVAAHKINLTAAGVGYVPPFDVSMHAFEGARRWIEQVTDQDYGKAGYLSRGSGSARTTEMLDVFPADKSASMTAIGMMIRQIVPGDDAKHDQRMLNLGMKLLTRTTPRWSDEGTIDFYYWYYGSLATAALGGKAAEDWQRAFARVAVRNQRKDGDACMYAGSWDAADPWAGDGGRVYSTAIMMLGLQAPDRMRKFTKGRSDLAEALLEPTLPVDLRAHIVAAVGHHRVKGGDKALADALRHEAPEVRVAAATAMGKLTESNSVVRQLVGALKDKERSVQRAAAHSLRHVRPIPSSAVAPLLNAMKAKDHVIRTHVATALGGALKDPTVAPVLRAALKDASERVQVAAAGSLWSHQEDPTLIPIWVAGLTSADLHARADGAKWVARVGAPAISAKPALESALADKDPWVLAHVALALQALDPSHLKLVPVFAELLNTPDTRVEIMALKALATIGPRAGVATTALIRVVRQRALPLQRLGIAALTAIGSEAAKAAPTLWYVATEGDARLRPGARAAITALKLDPRRATAIYISKLDFKDKELARGAIAGLGAVGVPAVPALVTLLTDQDKNRQIGALRALSSMGEHAAPAMDRLRRLLSKSQHASVRAWSARTLGSIGKKAGASASSLIAQFEDRTMSVAVECAGALGHVGSDSEGAVTALSKLLLRKGKNVNSLHAAAMRSLGMAGKAAEPVIPDMIVIAGNRERAESLRDAAREALAALGPDVALAHMQAALTKGSARGGNEPRAHVACQVLTAWGPKSEDAVSELIEFLVARRSWRDGAGQALTAIGKPALRPLVKLLKHPLFEVRHAAVRAVGLLGPVAKSYSGSIKRLRKDPDEGVRAAAEIAYEQVKRKK